MYIYIYISALNARWSPGSSFSVIPRTDAPCGMVSWLRFHYTVWFLPRRHTGTRTHRRSLRYGLLAPFQTLYGFRPVATPALGRKDAPCGIAP